MKEHIRKRKIMAVTLIGSLANFLLLVFKFIAGVLGHSSAMIADAVHSLSDFVTDVIVLLFINISSKPKDEGHDYGHGKYETLATTIIGIVLMCVGAGLFWDGVNKVFGFYLGGRTVGKSRQDRTYCRHYFYSDKGSPISSDIICRKKRK